MANIFFLKFLLILQGRGLHPLPLPSLSASGLSRPHQPLPCIISRKKPTDNQNHQLLVTFQNCDTQKFFRSLKQINICIEGRLFVPCYKNGQRHKTLRSGSSRHICIYDNIYDDYDIFAWNVRIMSCVVACSSAEPFLCKYVLMIYFGSFCGLLCVQHRYDVESRRYCQSGGGEAVG